MKPACRFRLWLLTLCLVFGQMAMLVHAADHLDAGEAQHVCLDCLAGHDLGGAPPPAAGLAALTKTAHALCFPAAAPVLTVPPIAGGFARAPPKA